MHQLRRGNCERQQTRLLSEHLRVQVPRTAPSDLEVTPMGANCLENSGRNNGRGFDSSHFRQFLGDVDLYGSGAACRAVVSARRVRFLPSPPWGRRRTGIASRLRNGVSGFESPRPYHLLDRRPFGTGIAFEAVQLGSIPSAGATTDR